MNRLSEREQELLSIMAAATDLANSWARELGIEEAKDERGLHRLIGQLFENCGRND